MCENARSVADRFSMESIKRMGKVKSKVKVWEKVVNDLAADMLGIASPSHLWDPLVLRPIALGAPEYQTLYRYPAIIDHVGWTGEGYSKRLYLLLQGYTVVMNAYGSAPFYLIVKRVTSRYRLNLGSFLLPRLREAGFDEGLLLSPHHYHDQRVFSLTIFYMMRFFTTYMTQLGFMTPAPETEGRNPEFIVVSIAPSGLYLTREIIPPDANIGSPLHKGAMPFARLVYTPCEVHDALQLLAKEFKPLIYELDEYGGLALVDQYSLQNVMKRGGTEIEAIIIEANKPHKAKENAQLLVVYPMTLKLDSLRGDPMTFKDLNSPSSLYDAAVLARLG